MITLLELWTILYPKKAAKIPKWWALALVAALFALSALIWR
jgi:hypothetical protein